VESTAISRNAREAKILVKDGKSLKSREAENLRGMPRS
jgi:hypothetical protein